jgi:glutamate/aspartate transport system substrate-binding protein
MKIGTTLGIAALLALGAQQSVQAQPKDTLQKVKDTGVISLGGRDASFPFS